MKITTKNYLKSVKEVGSENLPEALQKFHSVMMTKTDDGKDWSVYANDADVKRVFNLAFKKLEEFINNNELSGIKRNSVSNLAKEDAASYKFMATDKLKMIYRLEKDAELENDGTPQDRKIRRTALEKELKKRGQSLSGKEEYDPIKEIHFIERFLAFNEKMIQKNTVKMFIVDLQKAIQEKKIRKHSPYAKQVVRLQEVAIQFHNRADNVNRLVLSKELLNDLYSVILDFENKISKPEKIDPIDPVDLSGIENETESEIMSSVDFAEMEFAHLGFTDKWLNLIGDPSPGFTAMIYGKPKMGKSYLAVDFAGYLAKNIGRVLYVSKEEKFSSTFANKLKEKNAAHENLIIGDRIPEDLSDYKFVFLDSINSLNLSAEDLKKLKEKYPSISFVYVFQTTKTGNFRGTNTFQHDVDIVIEIPERGRAVQFGRFNQGGEMQIFGNEIQEASEELFGINRKKKAQLPAKIIEADIAIHEPATIKQIIKDAGISASEYKNLHPGTKKELYANYLRNKRDNYPAWTRPKHLDERDHKKLKHIYDLYKAGDMREAMEYASYSGDTVIREEIPGDIWKKMGGTLTNTGEEKLRKSKGKKKNAQLDSERREKHDNPKPEEQKRIYFKLNSDHFKEFYENNAGPKITLGQYQQILEIANKNFEAAKLINQAEPFLSQFCALMNKAYDEYEVKNGKIDNEFDPKEWEKRKDDENPEFLFRGTSVRLLADAMEEHFILRDLVKRELANRGLNYYGKWVGFEKARKELNINK